MWPHDADVAVYLSAKGDSIAMKLSSKVIEQLGSEEFRRQLRRIRTVAALSDSTPNSPSFPDRWTTPEDGSTTWDMPKLSQTLTNGTDRHGNRTKLLNVSNKRSPEQSDTVVRYELRLPWPGENSSTSKYQWHLTTRNFFAILSDKDSVWGETYFKAFYTVYARVIKHPDYLPRNIDRAFWLAEYIRRKGFDDVRSSPSYAIGLLALSEMIHWKEGYIEAFAHCAGMYSAGLKDVRETADLSAYSHMMVRTANQDIMRRVRRAQAHLKDFCLNDNMWPSMSGQNCQQAKAAFNRFARWLQQYYRGVCGQWPPSSQGEDIWLYRDVIERLNSDFHRLYDFLVDRETVFSSGSGGPLILAEKKNRPQVKAGTIPYADILGSFDDRLQVPHMPHPYPLIPSSVSASPSTTSTKLSIFGPKTKRPLSPTAVTELAQSKAMSYSTASNLKLLRGEVPRPADEIVKQFLVFEEESGRKFKLVNPADARRGHWTVIYGVLQILATVGVDTPNLRWKEGVRYHLNPNLDAVIPWKVPGESIEPAGTHVLTHCWTVPKTWEEDNRPSSPTRPTVTIDEFEFEIPSADEDDVDAAPSGRRHTNSPVSEREPTRAHMYSPTYDTAREDHVRDGQLRYDPARDSGLTYTTFGTGSSDHPSNGRRSRSRTRVAGHGVGISRQAVPFRPVVRSRDGQTWIEDDDNERRSVWPNDASEGRRKAAEWLQMGADESFHVDQSVDRRDGGFPQPPQTAIPQRAPGEYGGGGGDHRERNQPGEIGVASHHPLPRSRLSTRRRRLPVQGSSDYEAPQGW